MYRRPSEFFAHCTGSQWVLTRPSHRPLPPRVEPCALHEIPQVTFSFSELKYLFECPYSFKLRFLYGSIAGPAEVDRDWGYLGAWMRQGYAIVATDYAGLGTPGEHPYLDGRVEAHNVVDAVRAATAHYPGLARKCVVVGQSQGAGAAVSTARYATTFGPDLDYRGAVATGTPAYIEDIITPLGPGVPPVA